MRPKRMTWMLAMMLMVGSAARLGAAVPVAADGEAKAAIVHNGHTKQAEALRDYLQRITGSELPWAETADGAAEGLVRIELKRVETLPGVSEERTSEHAYRLHTEGGNLFITALTDVGLLYAVYGLLQDHLAVGFFTPDCESIPDSPTLVVPELDDVQEPSLYGRGMNLWAERSRTADWSNKNRAFPLDGHVIKSAHNFTGYGTRENCPLDADFQRRFGERLSEQFAGRSADASPLAVGQMDGNFELGCNTCEACEALIEAEGSYSAPMLVMLNAALEHAGKDYPDHQIITFAYFNTLPVPKTIRPHANLWINIAASGRDHLNELRGNPEMTPYYGALRDWPQLAPGRVTTWHWARNYYARDYEWPNMASVVDTIKVWQDYGIVAGFMQEDRTGTHNWSELKHWVWSQVLWNTASDVDALIRRFLRGYYGEKAAPFLWAYFQEAERVRVATGVALDAHSPEQRMRASLLTPAVLETLDALLEQGQEAAREEADPAYEPRIAHARALATDKPIIDTLREKHGFARVADPRDGSTWFVAGGCPTVPTRIDRYTNLRLGPRAQQDFLARAGGRVFELESEHLRVAAVPQMQSIEERSGGNIVSIVHRPTGAEILAGDGYRSSAEVREVHWDVDDAEDGSVGAVANFSQHYWNWQGLGTLHKRIGFSEDTQGVNVTRRYHIRRLWQDAVRPSRYHAHWGLKLPNPAGATLTVSGGGLDAAFDNEALRQGDIELEVMQTGGELAVELDRGDGLVVRLVAENTGWEKLILSPFNLDPDDDPPATINPRRRRWPQTRDVWPVDPTPRLEITLRDGDDAVGNEPVALPWQRLDVRSR